MPENPRDEKLRCAYCGDVIGAYEPIIVVIDGEAQKTSRDAEQRHDRDLGECYHQDCYP